MPERAVLAAYRRMTPEAQGYAQYASGPDGPLGGLTNPYPAASPARAAWDRGQAEAILQAADATPGERAWAIMTLCRAADQ